MNRLGLLLGFFAWCSAAVAQLTLEDVLNVLATGMPQSALVAVIRDKGTYFDLSPGALKALREARADPAVIEALRAAETTRRRRVAVTPLMDAAFAGDLSMLRARLKRGMDPTEKGLKGFTPLMIAAVKGHEALARALIQVQNQSEIDVGNDEGQTALMVAARMGHDSIVTALIEAGADVFHEDANGWTAGDLAAMGAHKTTIRLLTSATVAQRALTLGAESWFDQTMVTELNRRATEASIPTFYILVRDEVKDCLRTVIWNNASRSLYGERPPEGYCGLEPGVNFLEDSLNPRLKRLGLRGGIDDHRLFESWDRRLMRRKDTDTGKLAFEEYRFGRMQRRGFRR